MPLENSLTQVRDVGRFQTHIEGSLITNRSLTYTPADVEHTIFEQGASFGQAYSMHPTVVRVLPRAASRGKGKTGRLFDLFTVSPEVAPNLDAKHQTPVRCSSPDRNVWIWPGMNKRTADWLELLGEAVQLAQLKDPNALAGLVFMQEAGDGISMCLSESGAADCPVLDLRTQQTVVNYARQGFHAPIFTMNKQRFDRVSVLTPDFEFVNSNGYRQVRRDVAAADSAVPFAQRAGTVFWRGSATGHGPPQHTDRARAAVWSQAERSRGQRWLDVKFTSLVGNNRALKKLKLEVVGGVGMADQLKYKYLLDLDGNGNAWSGCFWKLLTKESVSFKVDCGREQWYYPSLVPWKHYIPVACNLSDLKERFEWAVEHPTECQAIAAASAALVSRMTRRSEAQRLAATLAELSAARYQDPHRGLNSSRWLEQLRRGGAWQRLMPVMLQQHSEHDPAKAR